MTEMPFEERRRAPRHDLRSAAVALLPAVLNVRVREIGVLGLLLYAAEPLAIGSQASVRMTLSGVPFTADVRVRRVSPSRVDAAGGYEIAATFVAISPEHRQLIERFVSQ